MGCREDAGLICFPHSGSWQAQGGPVYIRRYQRKRVFHNMGSLKVSYRPSCRVCAPCLPGLISSNSSIPACSPEDMTVNCWYITSLPNSYCVAAWIISISRTCDSVTTIKYWQFLIGAQNVTYHVRITGLWPDCHFKRQMGLWLEFQIRRLPSF